MSTIDVKFKINEKDLLITIEKDVFNVLNSDDNMLFHYLTNVISQTTIKGFEKNEVITSIQMINDEYDVDDDLSESSASTSSIVKTNEGSIDEDLFILLVSERPALYDSSINLKFRSKPVKDKLWLDIKNILKCDLTISDLAKKWKALRDYYCKIKTDIKKIPSGAATDQSKLKKWKHLENMRFLDKTLEKRETFSNTSPLESPVSVTTPTTTFSSLKRKKVPSEYSDELFLGKLESIMCKPVEVVDNTKQTDGVSNFCERLAEGLRKLPYRKRCEIEIKFLQDMCKALDECNITE